MAVAVIIVTLMMTTMTMLKNTAAMDACDTRNAICIVNGRLQGSVLFTENKGFGCRNGVDEQGLHLDIDLEGFDPEDKVSLKVKAFAGMTSDCRGMGPDFGQDSRRSYLGTYYIPPQGGALRVTDVLSEGPSLWGDNSLLGRSVAVSKEGDTGTLDCCVIGAVDLTSSQQPYLTREPPSSPPLPHVTNSNADSHSNNAVNSFNNNVNNGNSFSDNAVDRGGNPFPGPSGPSQQTPSERPGHANSFSGNGNSFSGSSSGFGGSSFGDLGFTGASTSGSSGLGSPLSGGTPSNSPPAAPQFPGSGGSFRDPFSGGSSSANPGPAQLGSFRAPFSLDNQLSSLDLSGKTSRVSSFSPDSVGSSFRAPEPPRFQDIYGVQSGKSPLSRSGYGNTVGPSRESALSRLFFQDGDVRGSMDLGLTAEEMTIPRESGEEESSTSFHQERAVDQDPGYDEDAADQSPSYDVTQDQEPGFDDDDTANRDVGIDDRQDPVYNAVADEDPGYDIQDADAAEGGTDSAGSSVGKSQPVSEGDQPSATGNDVIDQSP